MSSHLSVHSAARVPIEAEEYRPELFTRALPCHTYMHTSSANLQNYLRRRLIYKEHTSIHAQGTDPRAARVKGVNPANNQNDLHSYVCLHLQALLGVCGGCSFGGLGCCSYRVCVCVSGVSFSVGVCVCDLLIFLPMYLFMSSHLSVHSAARDPIEAEEYRPELFTRAIHTCIG